MAKTLVAKTAGFCFGVERAVNAVYEELKKGGSIYTYGPIIHNDTVVNDLKERGVGIIDSPEGLKELAEKRQGSENVKVIIRSHGVKKEIYDLIEKNGLEIIDATCPFVKKIHDIVAKESREGRTVIIIGAADHAEVEGITGWCEKAPIVIFNKDEAENLSLKEGTKISVVSQTTFNHNKFQELVEIISKKGYDINVVDTICNATSVRQKEAAELSEKADAMIVIGGAHSSNSRKLYEICAKRCKDTLFVSDVDDLNEKYKDHFKDRRVDLIGITAGASTPKKIIEEVQNDVGSYV
ncbi:MAG TPA: 4-hydroxy-3-methylbut-2-enyl diphosphate reductase [Lachnospiraceae bacterium]|nr:4-hydroxy-3-methylbut-2-enyl diphosphate reductase [Lachnospiraceae bacterium]